MQVDQSQEINMDLGIKNKNALVCASSKGLGLAVAKRLYSEGVNLAICSRTEADLIKAVAEITESNPSGGKIVSYTIDLSDSSHIGDFATKIKSQLGTIDILVNNVGGPPPSSAEQTDIAAWQNGFNQLFLSSILLTKELIPAMKGSQWGRIITITSLSVVEPIDHLVVSTAMRSAVTAFMKTLSKELAPAGITVNTVQPGVIHTDRIVNLRKSKADRSGTTLESEMLKTSESIPAKRLGKPEELADLVAFLASKNAAYITGVNIPVDGGMRHSW